MGSGTSYTGAPESGLIYDDHDQKCKFQSLKDLGLVLAVSEKRHQYWIKVPFLEVVRFGEMSDDLKKMMTSVEGAFSLSESEKAAWNEYIYEVSIDEEDA